MEMSAKTQYVKDKNTGRLKGSVSLVGKKAPTAKKVIRKYSVKTLTEQEYQNLLDQDSSEEYAEKIIAETAEALYNEYLDSLDYYTPQMGNDPKKRRPFRVEDEKITKNYIRGSIYNGRGIKVGSYVRPKKENDSHFTFSFINKDARESFEKAVENGYALSGYSDPGSFRNPSYKVDSEQISRYLTFLHSKKYPKKIADFCEQARSLSPDDRATLRKDYL